MKKFIKRLKRSPILSDQELLSCSPLFDEEYYLRENPDVKLAGLEPVSHYLSWGAAEGRMPSQAFNAAAYLRDNPDVKVAGLNPLVHYLRFGKLEGRKATSMNEYSHLIEAKVDNDRLKPVARGNNKLLREKTAHPEERRLLNESGLFSPTYYLEKNPDVAAGGIDPLKHFLEYGWREGRNPHPDFDAEWYKNEYPDVASSGMDPLLHYLRIGRAEGRACQISPALIALAREMITEAGEIEPTILLDNSLLAPRTLSINHSQKGGASLRAWYDLFASFKRSYDYIVMVPWLVRGGADLAACNAVSAAIQTHGVNSTLLLLTDYDRTEALDWLPAGTHMRILSEFDTKLTKTERSLLVETLIVTMRPRAVLNVNSGALWDALAHKGGALAKATDVYACLFCRDYLPDGRAAGYADTHFRDSLPFIKRIYFDNEPFRQELIADYGVPQSLQSKMVTVRQPVSNSELPIHAGGPQERNAVMWAGRFCEQKNIVLLLEIVSNAPEFTFDVYGYGSDHYMEQLSAASKRLKNLRIIGPFSSTNGLPFEKYTAFLYTSLWDGLPLTLADVAARGIPIVASAVGGIPDLISEDTGWPILDYKNPIPYLEKLKEIQRSPEESMLKAKKMRDRVLKVHSWNEFISGLSSPPSFLD